MARSLLRQLEQIRRAATYADDVAGVNTSPVAEPTVSGSLEEDTNVIRTLMKQIKGTTDWYSSLPTYTDPTATDTPKEASLTNFSGHTLDAKTIIIAVTDDNAGNGYTVSGTSTGVLLSPNTTNYADAIDKTGLPIFASTANSGSYLDEGNADNICRIDVVNSADDSEFQTADGHVVYAKFHDGADFGGSGENTDVYARFYANDAEIDLTTISGGAPSNIYFVYPRRKTLASMQEHEWLRTDFISSWEGDIELIEDIQHLWSYTGSSDGVSSTAGSWSNATGNFVLSSDPADLFTAADLLNTGIGNRTYSEGNYLTDGTSITAALDTLDQQLQDIEDSVDAGLGEKFVESVASEITANTPHTLPAALISAGGYTPDATAGREGSNMDIYVDGQLLAASTGNAGANADRDYKEEADGASASDEVTFLFTIQAGRNITYIVRQ
jgi:hypothetical protein